MYQSLCGAKCLIQKLSETRRKVIVVFLKASRYTFINIEAHIINQTRVVRKVVGEKIRKTSWISQYLVTSWICVIALLLFHAFLVDFNFLLNFVRICNLSSFIADKENIRTYPRNSRIFSQPSIQLFEIIISSPIYGNGSASSITGFFRAQ